MTGTMGTKSDGGVRALVYMLDQAFEDDDEHSLLANLVHVTPEDWLARPSEGSRTIREIVDHVGAAKYAYWDHMFGTAKLSMRAALRRSPSRRDSGDIPGVKAWLRAGHERVRGRVAALADDDLLAPRKTHWGEVAETRYLISVLIEHDVYHAGEINHLRAQRQGDDRWPGQEAQ
jgi:uncharacterized damage-inducible protein DinB